MPEDVPNPFDELSALVQPRRFLHDPRATGEGISVCVIDSGMERHLLEERAARRGHTLHPIEGGIFLPDRAEPLPYDGKHSTPHGTTVADILLTIAPRVKLYSADVFGPMGSCEVETVLRALYWAIDVWKVKIVNLSLGVTEQRLQQLPKRNQLMRAIEEGYYRDVLIFAAAHNDHPLTRSYPALFTSPLISVDKKVFLDPMQFSYELRHQIEFQAHAQGYLGPFAQEPATSWAAPHLAGIAARLLSLKPDLKPFEMKTLLYWLHRSTKVDP